MGINIKLVCVFLVAPGKLALSDLPSRTLDEISGKLQNFSTYSKAQNLNTKHWNFDLLSNLKLSFFLSCLNQVLTLTIEKGTLKAPSLLCCVSVFSIFPTDSAFGSSRVADLPTRPTTPTAVSCYAQCLLHRPLVTAPPPVPTPQLMASRIAQSHHLYHRKHTLLSSGNQEGSLPSLCYQSI